MNLLALLAKLVPAAAGGKALPLMAEFLLNHVHLSGIVATAAKFRNVLHGWMLAAQEGQLTLEEIDKIAANAEQGIKEGLANGLRDYFQLPATQPSVAPGDSAGVPALQPPGTAPAAQASPAS